MSSVPLQRSESQSTQTAEKPATATKPAPRQRFSRTEKLLIGVDQMLQTLSGVTPQNRPSPAQHTAEPELSDTEQRHAASLMRVNHCGEVCAQAMYRGQAAVCRNDKIRRQLLHACDEEADHLNWCATRLKQLNARGSILNPLWYSSSWTLGALAGLAGDKFSLGWLAATEDQVAEHLEEHLRKLPAGDIASRKIIETMLTEERQHGTAALRAGAWRFPNPARKLMRQLSKLMTWSTYRI